MAIVITVRQSSDSLVVMTSALHAEGREFNPRSEQFFFFCTHDCSLGRVVKAHA